MLAALFIDYWTRAIVLQNFKLLCEFTLTMSKFQNLLQNTKNVKQMYVLLCKSNIMSGVFTSRAQFSRTTLQSRRFKSEYKEIYSQCSSRNLHTADISNNEIDCEQLKAKMKDGLSIIDVRNPDEIEKNGGVQGALVIPLPVLKDAFNLPPDEWKQKYNRVKPEPEDQIMLICAAGVRSKKGVKLLKELGYKNLFSFKGGHKNLKEQKSCP